MTRLTVRELIERLRRVEDQGRQVRVSVGWAADTATSSLEAGLSLNERSDGELWLEGWLENCGTELEFEYDDEEEED